MVWTGTGWVSVFTEKPLYELVRYKGPLIGTESHVKTLGKFGQPRNVVGSAGIY